MDNRNLSKIPVSELTPAELDVLRGPESSRPKSHRLKPHRIIFVIIAALLLIGLGIALYFLLQPKRPNEPETEPSSPEVTWDISPAPYDPDIEYSTNLQSVLDNPDATPEEKLRSEIRLANVDVSKENFSSAESRLNAISRDNLTHRQLFNLYSAYAFLYEHSGNEAKHSEYSALVDEVLNQHWDEETK